MLVQKSNPRQHSKPDPQLRVSGPDHPDHNPRAPQPEQRLKRIHRKKIVDRQNPARREHANPCQRLRKNPSAHFLRDHHADRDFPRSRKRRQQSISSQRIPHHPPHHPSNPRNQRRLIDVSPTQMLAARDVIHLVPKNPVVAPRDQIHNHLHRRQRHNHRIFHQAQIYQYSRARRISEGAEKGTDYSVPNRHSYKHRNRSAVDRAVPFSAPSEIRAGLQPSHRVLTKSQ
jgi:hypothetical protein